MPRALAIETSGRLGSVAIAEDGVVVAEDVFAHGLKHAAEMLPRIDALVKRAGWKPADLREIYVSIGPGSFTGLRIGITLAKTLAFATGAKIAAVPSVQVLAHNVPPEARDVLIVLDAKREQIFTATLHRDDPSASWNIVQPARLDSLTNALAAAPRPIHLVGEGIPYHEKFLPKDDPRVIVTPAELWQARASIVVKLGYELARRGEWTEPRTLLPLYIRKPEAEEKLDAQRAESAEKLKSP